MRPIAYNRIQNLSNESYGLFKVTQRQQINNPLNDLDF